MKEGEIQIISNTCSGNVSNYSNYKTMRNDDVVQVERWDSKAWDGTFYSHIVVHGSGRHGQFGGIWSKTINTYRCSSIEEANIKGSRKLEKFLRSL